MITDKQHNKQIEIDLTGPDGNAFALMGQVKGWCKQMSINSEPIINDMMGGDYEHLLSVIEKHFGHVVTMYR
jgi:hypothetical protein